MNSGNAIKTVQETKTTGENQWGMCNVGDLSRGVSQSGAYCSDCRPAHVDGPRSPGYRVLRRRWRAAALRRRGLADSRAHR